MAAVLPTATMRFPLIATASTSGWLGLTVQIFPLMRIRSMEGCAMSETRNNGEKSEYPKQSAAHKFPWYSAEVAYDSSHISKWTLARAKGEGFRRSAGTGRNPHEVYRVTAGVSIALVSM